MHRGTLLNFVDGLFLPRLIFKLRKGDKLNLSKDVATHRLDFGKWCSCLLKNPPRNDYLAEKE
jgi:hypothetical protein